MDLGVLRRWWPIAAVTVLLAVAALAAGHSSIGASRIPPAADNIPYVPDYPSAEPAPSIAVEPRDGAEATQAQIPDWIVTAAMVVLGLAALLAIGYVGWTLVRGALRRTTRAIPAQRARRTAEGTAREVVAALDAGLVELDDRATDPRTAVIACWVRLEEAAEEAGVPRLAGDTPTDLVSRLLRGDPAAGVPAIASADVLDGFAHVYREARYATHTVDERMRDQARAALRRLRGELTNLAGQVAP
ncbi:MULTISPECIES: DUF4129 domain-containing protein [Micromonospora]|uniref:DUF4129 domain-containing protein n=1 Tax=Micromonospora sicca TaxID=2202420 RepID=A0A317D464_9ACTN|nr:MULTISPECIES: DUF4129 domain-containing protein [unclassified Micromonospora]MBM0225715.1 DUF4129 domain-containing protein [Micromonospora sp. ATA51]MDZ5442023.1 DUF4129 domain-containing protein [Micromonospora sp. 4G57]MDZ5490550.1 DUF4129 domain-containing protein [Micromonospora sp. 4G53]PWR09132.1 hypothetical protein DKT69_31560 [Micromonospora sp. 4G51]